MPVLEPTPPVVGGDPAPIVLALDWDETPFPIGSEFWVAPASLTACIPAGVTVDTTSVAATTTEILRLLSGRKYGIRRGTVRPHRMVDQFLPVGVFPVPTGFPFGFGVTGALLGYDDRQLILDGPANVLAVKVDGVALVAGVDWTLYDRRLLVRMAGGAGSIGWPLDQRLDLPDTAQGTWSVTYESGAPVTAGAKLAALAYGCYLTKQAAAAVGGSSTCTLPARTTNVSRQGVTITRAGVLELLQEGKTGVEITDQWLAAVNPNKLQRRARIAGPETYIESRAT